MAGGLEERPGRVGAGAAGAGGGDDRRGRTTTAGPPESDGDDLARLLADAWDLIIAVVGHPDWQNPPSDEAWAERWAEAWSDALQTASPRLELLIDRLRQPDVEPYLASEGLTGPELQVKTAVYWAVRAQLEDLFAGEGRLAGWVLRALRIDLQAAINLLESLTGLPGAGQIAEILKAVQVALDVLEYLAKRDQDAEPA